MIHYETSNIPVQTANDVFEAQTAREHMQESESKTARQTWDQRFRDLYANAVKSYEAGGREPAQLFTNEDTEFLASIGATPQEIYDFVEDWSEVGEPSFEVVQRITEVRQEYFQQVQKGQPSLQKISTHSLPPMRASLGGLAWLPRIIEKAKAKLRGEMPPDLMYGCGGDRPFLRKVGIEPDEFLRLAWSAGDDNQVILDYLNKKAK